MTRAFTACPDETGQKHSFGNVHLIQSGVPRSAHGREHNPASGSGKGWGICPGSRLPQPARPGDGGGEYRHEDGWPAA
eukprot:CAMPEP_0168356668 /NCGR_PEP_ID=MMETSP0228-20121227/167_1 /TAXON_ID=133427 /ORGANISM="Protoceratium reticulatum, Strain CCCM 535 (=CCMP 1889)" /LENGTH=77 /DNA_ID=CAMNT_0008369117 /DNA_START=99 /DNA_END=329 /DNA_ORIENTATION=+